MAEPESAQADPFAGLAARIEHVGAPQRGPFRRRLKGLQRRARKGQPYDRGLRRLSGDVEAAARARAAREAHRPTELRYPPDLPVCEARERLLAAIAEHQVVVGSAAASRA